MPTDSFGVAHRNVSSKGRVDPEELPLTATCADPQVASPDTRGVHHPWLSKFRQSGKPGRCSQGRRWSATPQPPGPPPRSTCFPTAATCESLPSPPRSTHASSWLGSSQTHQEDGRFQMPHPVQFQVPSTIHPECHARADSGRSCFGSSVWGAWTASEGSPGQRPANVRHWVARTASIRSLIQGSSTRRSSSSAWGSGDDGGLISARRITVVQYESNHILLLCV